MRPLYEENLGRSEGKLVVYSKFNQTWLNRFRDFIDQIYIGINIAILLLLGSNMTRKRKKYFFFIILLTKSIFN